MAILPIDLQTLFSQMDKVGKTQAQQAEGVQVQQALLNAAGQKRADAKVRTVNEAEASSEGPDQVTDKGKRDARSRERPDAGKRGRKDDEDQTPEEVVKDPNLGRNIDLSG